MKKLIALIMIILIFMVYADKSNASQKWQPKAGENWIGINKEQLQDLIMFYFGICTRNTTTKY